MNIEVKGAKISPEEQQAYADHVLKENPGRKLESLTIEIDGDYASLYYNLEPVPFDRIRRITGYLVGSLDRWNDAKRAEERDRVKHGLGEREEINK